VADYKFTVRFLNAQLIKEWEKFNHVKMRSVKAEIQIDPWNGSIGAKAQLQSGWFRVRGIPFDTRSKETVVYVGSLVGATSEIDMSTLNGVDYVRVKITAKDILKVPEVVEGAILPYLYDLYYEREVVMEHNQPKIPIVIPQEKGGEQPSSKRTKMADQRSSMAPGQPPPSANKGWKLYGGSGSAPPKGTRKCCVDKPIKLMADAQKGYFKKGSTQDEELCFFKSEENVQSLSGTPSSYLKMKMTLLWKGKKKGQKLWTEIWAS
jgi:hypothetical protein